ncbi:hypothetical protein [Hippea alviniae]|uniref:hypothetical protein n=1 Tax=Hippea alviniae TaxID=1279027 RepID=UPI0003B673DC|nr:hypothetical protein [Hippea alviniae]
MEIKIKKDLIKRRKNEVPPHVLEMGLNMLFVEPNDAAEFFKKSGVVLPVDIEELNEKEFESVLLDLTDMPYDERLDSIGFAKQNNTSMITVFKDLVLDEYQIYMYRIYGADAILFPVKPITSKLTEKVIFICESMGMLPIPLVEDEEDLSKITSWEFVRAIAVKDNIGIDKDVLLLEYEEGSSLKCLSR